MFKPDFLITPYVVKADENLRPSDGDVYATIYWFERLRDGKCTASNEAIAEVACCGVRNVRGSLDRLEKYGYIQRYYEDEARTRRSEIKTLLSYRKDQPLPTTPGLPGIPEPRQETPGEFATRFFQGEPDAVDTIIKNLIDKTGAPEDALTNEVRKFILYWTEPNKSGTKVRWQQQTTFEVKRRLYTWFGNKKEFNRSAARAGAGREI